MVWGGDVGIGCRMECIDEDEAQLGFGDRK